MWRRLLRFFTGILIGLGMGIALLSFLAYLLRHQIWQWIQEQLSSQLSARITIRDFSVNGWQGFPALTVNLYELTIATFQGETLFTCQKLSVYLNFYEALIEKRYRVIGLRAEAPYLRLHWNKAGLSAWNTIFRPSTDTTATTWHIETLIIQSGRLSYTDEKSRIALLLDGISLKSSLSHTPLLDTTWHFSAQLQTTLGHLSTPTTPTLGPIPLSLQARGAFMEKHQQILIQNLRATFSALNVNLGGYLQWKQALPYLNLRIAQIAIDFERLVRFWPHLPREWPNWPGQITATGTLKGFVGQGHLPSIDLKATLYQKKPFEIADYLLRTFHAKVRLHWHPITAKESTFIIDSLQVSGQQDSLTGKGKYTFSTRLWSAEVQGLLHLTTLRILGLTTLQGKAQGKASAHITPDKWELNFVGRLDSLRYDTLTLESYQGQLSLAQTGETWQIQAQGQLTGLTYAPLAISRADLKWSPDALTLTRLKGQYETLRLEAPFLSLHPGTEPWRQERLVLSGYLYVPELPFPLPVPQTSDSASPSPALFLNLQVAAETLLWQKGLYGPLRASLRTGPDTLTLQIHHLGGFARSTLQGTLKTLSPKEKHTLWMLQLKAQNLHIPSLRKDLPVLDSLFPLLPHLQGEADMEVNATLPFSEERLIWTEARAQATLLLRNFVVHECPYTYKLFSIIPLTDFKRIQVGQVHTHLSLRDGVIQLDTTFLQANEWRLWISGSHTLKNDLAYQLLVEIPRNLLLKGESRVSDAVDEIEGERLSIAINVTGKADNPTFSWQIITKKPEKRSNKRPEITTFSSSVRQDSLPLEAAPQTHPAPPSKKSPLRKEKPALPVEESPR